MRLITVLLAIASLALSASVNAQVPKATNPVTSATSATNPATPVAASKAVSIVELDTIAVLALSQADGRAVLALPDQQMVVVKSGDPVPRTRAVLTNVLGDKLALEEKSADGKSRQLVWMHKGQGGKTGRIERFTTDTTPVTGTPAPQRTVVPVKSPNGAAAAAAARKP